MLLSIIVPVYNSEKTIARCLNSLPSSNDVEIIVINDGSTDSTEFIIKDLMQSNSSIKLYAQKNAGPQKAINLGIMQASGKYVSFIDSDDTLSENYFSILESYLRNNEAEIISFSYNRINKNITNKVTIEASGLYADEKLKELQLNYLSNGTMQFSHLMDPARWNKIFKTDILLNNLDKFSESYKLGEDILMTTLCVLAADKILCLKDCYLYNYFETENSLSKSSELLDYWEKYCQLALLIFAAYKENNFETSECSKVKGIVLYFSKSILKMGSKKYSFGQFKSKVRTILEDPVFKESLLYVDKKKLNISNKLFLSFLKHKNYFLIYCLLRKRG